MMIEKLHVYIENGTYKVKEKFDPKAAKFRPDKNIKCYAPNGIPYMKTKFIPTSTYMRYLNNKYFSIEFAKLNNTRHQIQYRLDHNIEVDQIEIDHYNYRLQLILNQYQTHLLRQKPSHPKNTQTKNHSKYTIRHFDKEVYQKTGKIVYID